MHNRRRRLEPAVRQFDLHSYVGSHDIWTSAKRYTTPARSAMRHFFASLRPDRVGHRLDADECIGRVAQPDGRQTVKELKLLLIGHLANSRRRALVCFGRNGARLFRGVTAPRSKHPRRSMRASEHLAQLRIIPGSRFARDHPFAPGNSNSRLLIHPDRSDIFAERPFPSQPTSSLRMSE
jgi:hypothetical protein